ncbi:MAG: NAD-dependent epimerase/dehydratase family protein [Alphaproteobacteria bacterium]
MTTLITGGTGLIGACLAAKLLARGGRVVLFDLAPAEWRITHLMEHGGDRLSVVRGDVVSLVDLLDAFHAHHVTAVVHLAYVLGFESNAYPELATRVNLLGTLNVLEAARHGGVKRVILASSIAVYGSDDDYRPEELPLTEEAPLYVARGLPVYGAGKVYLEQLGRHYASRYGFTVAGLRPSIVYGWGRRSGASSFAGELADRAAMGEPATVGFGDARISLVYVDDVAEQFVALLEADPSRFARHRFFNTGGDRCTVRELAETVRRLLPGARIEVRSAGEQNLGGLATSLSDRGLEEEIGIRRKFTPIEVGLRAQIDVARARALNLSPSPGATLDRFRDPPGR